MTHLHRCTSRLTAPSLLARPSAPHSEAEAETDEAYTTTEARSETQLDRISLDAEDEHERGAHTEPVCRCHLHGEHLLVLLYPHRSAELARGRYTLQPHMPVSICHTFSPRGGARGAPARRAHCELGSRCGLQGCGGGGGGWLSGFAELCQSEIRTCRPSAGCCSLDGHEDEQKGCGLESGLTHPARRGISDRTRRRFLCAPCLR